MLKCENTILLIIDVQEKLVKMLRDDSAVNKACILAKSAAIMGIDTIVTEQYPKGLGSTSNTLKSALPLSTAYFEKTAFSAFQEDGFDKILRKTGKTQVILCGIEAHICVYQTALDLITEGYDVVLAKDACDSRNQDEFDTGIELIDNSAVKVSCVEIILFELLKTSKNPHFKAIQALIR